MRKLSFGKAINEALDQEMERDEKVFVLGEDVAKMGGDFGITRGLWKKYGDKRVKDTPLSEAAILGIANGAAMAGLRPVAEIMFADFITEGYDQLVNNSAKIHFMFNGTVTCPLVVRTANGAGFHAAYHHSQTPEAWFLNVPGLYIVAPSTPYEAKGLLIASIRDDNPVIFLEHKLLYEMEGEVPEEPYMVELGKARVRKEGKDATLIASQRMVYLALEAAEELSKEDIQVEVIDLRTLFPLDKDAIFDSVAKTGRVVLVNEAPKTGNYVNEISQTINEEMFEFLKAPIKRVTGLDAPTAFAPKLEEYYLPHKEDIIREVKEIVEY
ncbi:MAG TPA: alpha-ketoacid dehydrogenase subunit beta [Candidatus Atribacteria bacterium]|uniref:Acetoin dehydrogenase E1 component beta subunit n=1 Tax=candidate division TA06 bacterium 34_109 TaxID=1635277 RepID=A0A117M631_UNCT6|nr:MAG: Acetoin dehydrogenase E1 component beta subunit [candidate division TA06 bacterium 34_109]HBY57217.1 alpha-ketoacid dehydrogenase subunit beta [Candidatus Atribacteria bacterium]